MSTWSPTPLCHAHLLSPASRILVGVVVVMVVPVTPPWPHPRLHDGVGGELRCGTMV